VGLSFALVILSRRDGHLGDPRGARQAPDIPASADRRDRNNSIRQIGELGFELLIGDRLFDAIDGVSMGRLGVRSSSSTTVMSICAGSMPGAITLPRKATMATTTA
jgi:hypothetical protein